MVDYSVRVFMLQIFNLTLTLQNLPCITEINCAHIYPL
jgi:hypothetical protein